MPSPTKVHLVLLIHGLWGCPAHLRVAKEELEAAWVAAHPAQVHAVRADADSQVSGPAEDPVITKTLKVSPSPSSSSSHAQSHAGLEEDGDGEELVIMIAGGMTSQLTYDGIDVCASRVAWEVDEKVKELESQHKLVVKFSVTGYSLGGLVARYLIGLLHSRSPSFFDTHKPISFSTLSSPHYGIPRYNTLLSTLLCWLGARIMSRSGEQLYVVDKYSEDDPRPLLEIMADPPGSVFYHGLEKFERLSLFAAAINDNSVPYPTAAIETVDHFAQWQDQGLVVDCDEAGMIRSWSRGEDEEGQEDDDYNGKAKANGNGDGKERGKGRPVKKSLGTYIGTLPPVLRYRFPFNYVILLLFPIMLPIVLCLILARQSLDTSRSKRRLQQLAQTSSSTFTASQTPITSSASGLSIQHLRDTVRRIERNIESEFIENADGPSLDIYNNSTPLQQVVIKAQLKDSQLRMALWLNQLPFKKYLTWWPEITNAHATAIVRDAHLFPQHERGRGMLKFWAKVMLGQATNVS
ncbi:lipid particle protein [Cryptococcus neoformans]|uniref:Lipid particle protein n=1 Tax=Cryptococcus neoformans (strain H99 / ATCC 208821 / CBS 10515 / FGSC 9487) TaxID=235443 RepID=J9VLQ4_CRYN9|nr:lipid particle protein [Cryptococcus neoformans var. grubii H99]AFR95193.2 lipid particle protein [Cryptococcus neoformans var. grubii H99]AUB24959.1 lipid particle protein [Cryptococcus neoformans var. grubii]OXH11221.1 lipid particle protein [Cryptococcus neoformans var. grubii]OXH70451.1 lipid particle protein [Cryptococcus neoformans var. grubii]|eukprot:XP_012049116.1 lipid particle protein [Cryptococcus neoformans var. grubii H99]